MLFVMRGGHSKKHRPRAGSYKCWMVGLCQAIADYALAAFVATFYDLRRQPLAM